MDLPWLSELSRPKKPKRLPTVLTVNEVRGLLDQLEGTHQLMARLLYGTGMRLMEVCLVERYTCITLTGGRYVSPEITSGD